MASSNYPRNQLSKSLPHQLNNPYLSLWKVNNCKQDQVKKKKENLHVTCYINASLWPDVPEKLLIMGYSPPRPFLLLTFYQNSYGIFLLPRQYRFAQLLQPVPHLHLTGLFSPLLDLVVFQCCSNYATVTASLFPSSCSPLHWNKSQTTDLWIWVISQNIYFCLLRNICKAYSFAAPQQVQL